jgi:UDP-2,3-diacylglucosamine hydrolase
VPTIAIVDGAIFIADAHYPHYGDSLLKILENLESGKLQAPQLFLMGDIFDLLFGYNNYILKFSQRGIELLQKLSYTMEIYYMEGNHDFCLKGIFPKIRVYRRAEQPIKFRLGERDVYLAHGDRYETGFLYNLYSKLLKTRFTLKILSPFERQIIDYQIQKLQRRKYICREIPNFREKVERIVSNYPPNTLIVEAHFHQGRVFENYISLSSLVCQDEVGVVLNGDMKIVKLSKLI